MQYYAPRMKSYRSFPKNDNSLSQVARFRLEKIKPFKLLQSEGVSVETALTVIQVKRATFYRWYSAFNKLGPRGLEPQSKRPKTIRKSQWSRALEQHILALRRQFPLWGKKTLTTLLRRDYGHRISESTVGRILTKLVRLNKIKPVCFYYGKLKPKKKRVFNKHARRLVKGMKSASPGELIQVDHMSVKVGPGFNVKHFEAICPTTKIVIAEAYRSAGSINAKRFLEKLINALPLKIKSIQVDGGSEFMKEFENAC